MTSITDKVWITARTRMIGEARLRRQALLWNLLIIWYSVGLTCLAVYQLIAENDPQRNLAATILSILVLALSIYIPTLGFKRQADQYRACYLKLQRLLDTNEESDRTATCYHDILEQFPNHANPDWIALLVVSEREGRPIQSGGSVVPVTLTMKGQHYARNVRTFSVWLAAFAVPFALFSWLLG